MAGRSWIPDTNDVNTTLCGAKYVRKSGIIALAAFRQALALDPLHAAAYNGIGRVHYHTGPPEEAIANYEGAIAIDPHYVAPYWGIDVLYFAQLGDYDQAIATVRRALAQIPGEALFHVGIGHTLLRGGNIEEAIAAYDEAVRMDPEFAYLRDDPRYQALVRG